MEKNQQNITHIIFTWEREGGKTTRKATNERIWKKNDWDSRHSPLIPSHWLASSVPIWWLWLSTLSASSPINCSLYWTISRYFLLFFNRYRKKLLYSLFLIQGSWWEWKRIFLSKQSQRLRNVLLRGWINGEGWKAEWENVTQMYTQYLVQMTEQHVDVAERVELFSNWLGSEDVLGRWRLFGVYSINTVSNWKIVENPDSLALEMRFPFVAKIDWEDPKVGHWEINLNLGLTVMEHPQFPMIWSDFGASECVNPQRTDA